MRYQQWTCLDCGGHNLVFAEQDTTEIARAAQNAADVARRDQGAVILKALSGSENERMSIRAVAEKTALQFNDVADVLLKLERQGVVRRTENKFWRVENRPSVGTVPSAIESARSVLRMALGDEPLKRTLRSIHEMDDGQDREHWRMAALQAAADLMVSEGEITHDTSVPPMYWKATPNGH